MTHYNEELRHLKDSLLTMASHAEAAVVRAMRALTERDEALARQVEDDDSILDQYEIEIDDTALHLLAKAPLATDLRLITVAMKISQNLERVGDEAVTIARRARDLNAEPQLKAYVDLPRMAAASGCGFRIDRDSVPLTPGCTIDQALGDGEDFELLLAVAPDAVVGPPNPIHGSAPIDSGKSPR